MRIAIVGNSGSGKSTLAHAIAHERGWPALDLDTLAWEPQKVAVPRDAAAARADVECFCDEHSDWIVEGCYADLIAASLRHAPLLIFIDPGADQCVANCRRRPWEAHKFRSKAEQDEKLAYLLDWVRDYYVRDGSMSLKAHEALFRSYTGPKRRVQDISVPRSELLAAILRIT